MLKVAVVEAKWTLLNLTLSYEGKRETTVMFFSACSPLSFVQS